MRTQYILSRDELRTLRRIQQEISFCLEIVKKEEPSKENVEKVRQVIEGCLEELTFVLR